jgi:hypothetical protein
MTPPTRPEAWTRTAPTLERPLELVDLEEATTDNIIDEVIAHLSRFVAFPSEHDLLASALWILHAHTVDAAESTPRLAFLSPEPGSGKSRALEVLATVVPHPMEAVNSTPAALFRSVGKDPRPTILFDEIDTVFGPKAKENEELRGLLNAGHRRGKYAYKCVGDSQTVVAFPAYCAVALAGLHDLPDTLADRSIMIRMRRRKEGERVEPFRGRIHIPQGNALRDRVAEWAATRGHELVEYEPSMPPGVTDRPADVWEPLLAIAEVIGGPWPDKARQACSALVDQAAHREPSLSVKLLGDLRTVFADRGDPVFLPTTDLLLALRGLEEAPWATYGKEGLTARHLSARIKEYGVGSHLTRPGGTGDPVRGYYRNDLTDPWDRYLSTPPVCQGRVTRATSVTPSHLDDLDVAPVADVTRPWQGRGES